MKKSAIYIFLIISIFANINAQELKKVLDLKGTWKFYVGDDMEFAETNYNDKDWEEIKVPKSWESEGFPGFNGFAWYRFEIEGKKVLPKDNLILNLGCIDDADEVYFNGHLIGSKGRFPPNFHTAYDALRLYNIPSDLVEKRGKNQIAVRVYDDIGPGGITRGKSIGIYQISDNCSLFSINLEGKWKFKSGNNPEWALPNIDDSFWNDINVPGKWEHQGYDEYNGFGWYRKTITIDQEKPQHLILSAGQIDDFDRVYFNGYLIGSSMPEDQEENPVYENNGWQYNRNYYIPKSKVNWGGENTIAICVYDGYLDGGIINGPVEILTRAEIKLREENNTYSFNEIIDLIFGKH